MLRKVWSNFLGLNELRLISFFIRGWKRLNSFGRMAMGVK
jgi:hypothetical protein